MRICSRNRAQSNTSPDWVTYVDRNGFSLAPPYTYQHSPEIPVGEFEIELFLTAGEGARPYEDLARSNR